MTTNNTSAASAANAQHTPGPWYSYQHSTEFFPIVGTVSGHGLFHILRTGRSSVDDANARLIAAAPELLIILKNALGSLEACEIILQPKTERARLSADIRDARAAIAKAEGRA